MALLDRVKARTGADLADAELEAMISGIGAEIDARVGPSGPIEVTIGDPLTAERWMQVLAVPRPVDTAEPIAIVEIDPVDTGTVYSETELEAADYRVMHGGRSLHRLIGGPNPNSFWAPLVRVTYTPIGDQAARDEVTIRLIQLDLSYRGLIKSERAGDYQWAGSVSSDSYMAERNALIDSLVPRQGLVLA